MTDSDSSGSSSTPNHILIVSIFNVRAPVTIEDLHTIFTPYGEVQKIITFFKDNTLKALVQLSSVEAAVHARRNMEGKDIFQGCCHLRIGFSKLKDLEVKENGPRSMDFTQHAYVRYGGSQPLFPSDPPLFPPRPAGLIDGPEFGPGFGRPEPSHRNRNFGTPDFTSGEGCVVIVNGLNPEKVTCDSLFTLFGCYGDVFRVKIMWNKRECALIQFAIPEQTQHAVHYLNGVSFYGTTISVNRSKHIEVSLPRSSEDESAVLTQDYSLNRAHRFRGRGDRAIKTIVPPSQVLHVSNIYDGATEEELRKLFGAHQEGIPVVQFFKPERKMAFVRMDAVEDAIHALIALHNTRHGGKHMRISFTKKNPDEVIDSDHE